MSVDDDLPQWQPSEPSSAPPQVPMSGAVPSDSPADLDSSLPEWKPSQVYGETTSAAGAFGRGATDAASFGLRPAIEGMVKAGGEDSHPAAYDIYKAITNTFGSNPDPKWQADYNAGRQQALADDEAAQRDHPIAYLGGQLAGSLASPAADATLGRFATAAPSLLSSAAKEIGGGGLGRVASSAAAGTGLGGLYGAGSGISKGDTGSDLVSDVGTGAATGAGAGFAGGLLGEGIRAAYPHIASLFQSYETRAGNVLRDAATDPGAAAASIDEAQGFKPTLYQATQDPGLGALEKRVAGDNRTDFSTRAGEQAQNRADTTLGALQGIQPAGAPEDVVSLLRSNLDRIAADAQDHVDTASANAKAATGLLGEPATPEERGSALRGALQSAENATRKNESALWKAVDPDGTLAVNMAAARDAVSNVYGNLTQAAASGVKPVERQIANLIGNYREVEPFAEFTGLRSRVSTAMREELSAAGRTPTYARLSQLRGGLQDALDEGLQDYLARQSGEVAAGTRAPEDTAAARLQNIAEPIGPANKPARSRSLFEALSDAGGIAPNGEVRTIFGGRNKFIPGGGNLIRQNGLSLDDAVQLAKDRGYLADPSELAGGPQTVGHNELLDMLDEESRGRRQYPIGTSVARGEDRDELEHHLNNLLDDHLQDSGVDPLQIDPHIRDRALQLMERERLSPGPAHEQAVMEDHQRAIEQGRDPQFSSNIQGWHVPSDTGGAPVEGGGDQEAWWAGLLGKGAPARTVGDVNRGALAQARAPWHDFRAEAQPSSLQVNFDRGAADRLAAATAATRERAGTFGVEPLKGVLRRQDGAYKVQASGVPGRIFKKGVGGAEAVQSFRNAVGDEQALPLLHDAATDSMLQDARGADGLIDPKKLDTWLGKHVQALRAFPELAQRFRSVAEASKSVADAAAARKTALDDYQKSVLGDFVNLHHPDEVTRTVGGIFGQKDAVSQMRQLADAVAHNPDAVQGLRKSVLDHVMSKTASGDAINSKSFQNFLQKNEPVLRQVLEPEQVDAMKAISQKLAEPALGYPEKEAAIGKPTTLLNKIFTGLGLLGVEHAGEVLGSHVFGHGFFGSGLGSLVALPAYNMAKMAMGKMNEAGIEKINDLVKQAILNPQLAKTLLQKSTPQTEGNLWRLLGQRLTPASFYGANFVTGRASGGRVGEDERLKVGGMDFVIDTPRGEKRHGTDKHGSRWSSRVPAHYGRIDNLKVFIGPYIRSTKVFVIDQYDASTGRFDEHKALLGFSSRNKAIEVFHQAFSDERGGDRFGHVKEMTITGFKDWLKHGDRSRPIQDHGNLKGVAPAGRPANRRERVKSILARHGIDHSEI
jgi:hypothetical protein